MKKLILILLALIPSVAFAGTITRDGFIYEEKSAPSNPPANRHHSFYDSSDQRLKILDSSGVEHEVVFFTTGDTKTDEFCVTYEATGNKWELQACGSGGGDSITVDGAAVVDPDFDDGGDINFTDTSNVITATINAGSVDTAELADGAITNAKLADMANATTKCRTTSGTGDPEDCTAAQVRAILNVEDGATADQTAGEIKTAYESNANTNAFTDADHSKLDGIEAGADVTDATNVGAAGAVMDSDISAGEGFLRKTGAGAYEAIKSNLNASSDPGATDDSSAGYAIGSKWINTTGDKVFEAVDVTVSAAVWKDLSSAAGGGGDNVSIDSTSVTDPDFVSSGDIDFVNSSNTITANINAGAVDNAELAANAVTSDKITNGTIVAADISAGSITALELATNSVQAAEIATGAVGSDEINDGTVRSAEIEDSTIQEIDLKAVDTAADEECLTYEMTTGDFEWEDCKVFYGFRARHSASQSIPASTYTKVQNGTENFDPQGDYDSVTNYRYTPSKAGTYKVIASVLFGVSIADQKQIRVAIYKNGALASENRFNQSGSSSPGISVTDFIEMNGSTDYLEMYVYQTDTSSKTLFNYSPSTFFAASWVGE